MVNKLFNISSIVLYGAILLAYLLKFESFLTAQTTIVFLFLVCHLFKNKFTWYLLVTIMGLNISSYFIQCDTIVLKDDYFFSYYCGYKPFDLFNYLSMSVPMKIQSNYYDIPYLFYLLIGTIIVNLKECRNLYFR